MLYTSKLVAEHQIFQRNKRLQMLQITSKHPEILGRLMPGLISPTFPRYEIGFFTIYLTSLHIVNKVWVVTVHVWKHLMTDSCYIFDQRFFPTMWLRYDKVFCCNLSNVKLLLFTWFLASATVTAFRLWFRCRALRNVQFKQLNILKGKKNGEKKAKLMFKVLDNITGPQSLTDLFTK